MTCSTIVKILLQEDTHYVYPFHSQKLTYLNFLSLIVSSPPWNSLPTATVLAPSVNSFKIKLSNHDFSKFLIFQSAASWSMAFLIFNWLRYKCYFRFQMTVFNCSNACLLIAFNWFRFFIFIFTWDFNMLFVINCCIYICVIMNWNWFIFLLLWLNARTIFKLMS